jgi:hypothetical protein
MLFLENTEFIVKIPNEYFIDEHKSKTSCICQNSLKISMKGLSQTQFVLT